MKRKAQVLLNQQHGYHNDFGDHMAIRHMIAFEHYLQKTFPLADIIEVDLWKSKPHEIRIQIDGRGYIDLKDLK